MLRARTVIGSLERSVPGSAAVIQRMIRRTRLVALRSSLRKLASRVREEPDGVRLANGTLMHLPVNESRAIRLRQLGGTLDRSLIHIWQELVYCWKPTHILDVGANYGEVVLATPATEAHILALEPNPSVFSYLERSLATFAAGEVSNVSRRTISALPFAASRASSTLHFTIDDSSSGLSRVDTDGDIEVSAYTLDSLLATHCPVRAGDRLLVKLDVEGHERQALAGLEQTLRQCSGFRMLIEAINLQPEDFGFLLDMGNLFAVNKYDFRLKPLTSQEASSLYSRGRRSFEPFMKDLLLARG